MSLLIIIPFVVYLMLKHLRCFFRNDFSTSVMVSSFVLLLGLTGSWIVYLLTIKVSEVFFILFFIGIRCWYSVKLDKTLSISRHSRNTQRKFKSFCYVWKLHPFPDIAERLKFSLCISISEGFSILVLLLDKLIPEIDLDFLIFSLCFLCQFFEQTLIYTMIYLCQIYCCWMYPLSYRILVIYLFC